MRRIVIVGGGLAGHRAAEALRREGYDGQVLVVGDELRARVERAALDCPVTAIRIED